MFTGLLSFSRSLDITGNVSKFTKCLSLINLPYMTRPTLTDLNTHG